MSVIRVRSFGDQDECRDAVARICGRFALDALALIDSSTAEDFDPKMRLDFDPAAHTWEVLTSYLEAGRLLKEEVQAAKDAKRMLSPEKTAKSGKKRKRSRHPRLNFTGPW